VDAGVHHLQGKTKLVNATEQLIFLREFYRDKHGMLQRHIAVAQQITQYDYNNTYQYIIAREDMHVRWVFDAITDMGGEPEDQALPNLGDAAIVKGRGKHVDAEMKLIAADRDSAQAFEEKWRTRVEAHPNARHRSLLLVILGEVKEQKRFFEQALAGRTDLLGRRADGAGTPGVVLGNRWIEQ
jgi:hypothetical protein